MLPSSSLSVLIVTGEYPPAVGGVGDYTQHLAESLAGLGHQVTVLSSASQTPDAETSDGPPNPRVLREVAGWGRGLASMVVATARRAGAHVVHVQYQPAAYRLSGMINVLPWLTRQAGLSTPFVTTFHDLRVPYLFPKAGPLRALAVHALIGLSRASIFTDPSDLARAHPRRLAAWIPLAPNLPPVTTDVREMQRSRLQIQSDESVVAHFGFLNSTKGVDVLLRAAARLVASGINLRLLFVGDAEGSSDPINHRTARELDALAESLGLAARIVRTGYLSPEEVSPALAAADVAAQPFTDGASLRRTSLLACFAQGIPVVTTRPQRFRHLPERFRVSPFDDPDAYAITERVAALVAKGDHAALAREIADLLSNVERRERLAAAGRRLAESLSWQNVAIATTKIYERVTAPQVRATEALTAIASGTA